MCFIQTHIPQKTHFSVVEMVVSASLNLASFTCILEFALDPSFHVCDTVCGLDWSRFVVLLNFILFPTEIAKKKSPF